MISLLLEKGSTVAEGVLVACFQIVEVFVLIGAAGLLCVQGTGLEISLPGATLSCHHVSIAVVVAFQFIKLVAVLALSSEGSASTSAWALCAIAFCFASTVAGAGLFVLAKQHKWKAVVVGSLALAWLFLSLVSTILPRWVQIRWQQRKAICRCDSEQNSTDLRSNAVFETIEALLMFVSQTTDHDLPGVRCEPDGWVSVSQRRLADLLGCKLHHITKQLEGYRSLPPNTARRTVLVDTSNARTRLKLSDHFGTTGLRKPGCNVAPLRTPENIGGNTQPLEPTPQTISNVRPFSNQERDK